MSLLPAPPSPIPFADPELGVSHLPTALQTCQTSTRVAVPLAGTVKTRSELFSSRTGVTRLEE